LLLDFAVEPVGCCVCILSFFWVSHRLKGTGVKAVSGKRHQLAVSMPALSQKLPQKLPQKDSGSDCAPVLG
jgi:hypothetical protein